MKFGRFVVKAMIGMVAYLSAIAAFAVLYDANLSGPETIITKTASSR